jgi:hypothetical protein
MSQLVGVAKGNGSELDKFDGERGEQMSENVAEAACPISVAIAEPDEKPVKTGLALPIELGRVLRSPRYGKGYIAEIQDDAIRVWFWNHLAVTFHKPNSDYPFELLDEVREVKGRSIVEKALARETSAAKKERALRCMHNDSRALCVKCAALAPKDIKTWNLNRTTERRITRRGLSQVRYKSVGISSGDCVLTSRREKTAPTGEPLNEYQSEIGNGAGRKDYADAKPVQRAPLSEEAAIAKDLFANPTSGLQKGGTGYLRIPLSAPRASRAHAPEWLDFRGGFIRSLRGKRSSRAEAILGKFYVEGMTDEQIAGIIGWTKDAIKNERKHLLVRGNQFFRDTAAKHPPSPAIGERPKDNPQSTTPLPDRFLPGTAGQKVPSSPYRKKDYQLLPTVSIAVYSSEKDVLHMYPVFEEGGRRFVRTGGKYVPITALKGFLREEPALGGPARPGDLHNAAD